MALRRPGDKPVSEPTIASLLTHICVTHPQWVSKYENNNPQQLLSYDGITQSLNQFHLISIENQRHILGGFCAYIYSYTALISMTHFVGHKRDCRCWNATKTKTVYVLSSVVFWEAPVTYTGWPQKPNHWWWLWLCLFCFLESPCSNNKSPKKYVLKHASFMGSIQSKMCCKWRLPIWIDDRDMCLVVLYYINHEMRISKMHYIYTLCMT